MSKSNLKTNKIEKIFNQYKLIFNSDNDYIIISVNKINTYQIYNKTFNL